MRLGNDIIGRFHAGTVYCDECAPTPNTAFRRRNIRTEQGEWCFECGTELTPTVTHAATADILGALCDADISAIGTGGGCEALELRIADGWTLADGTKLADGSYVLITDGDASLPDGRWITAYLYSGTDDAEPREIFNAGHDTDALVEALHAVGL